MVNFVKAMHLQGYSIAFVLPKPENEFSPQRLHMSCGHTKHGSFI